MSSHTELTRGHREDGLLASSPPGRLVPAGHHTHVHAHAPTVQQRVNPHSCTSVRQTQHCMLQQLSTASDGASGTNMATCTQASDTDRWTAGHETTPASTAHSGLAHFDSPVVAPPMANAAACSATLATSSYTSSGPSSMGGGGGLKVGMPGGGARLGGNPLGTP